MMRTARIVVAGVALIAAIGLASCSSTESCPVPTPTSGSHTLVVWDPGETAYEDYPACLEVPAGPVTSGWVSVMPGQEAMDLWWDLTGEQLPEEGLIRGYLLNPNKETLNQLVLASMTDTIGSDGGVDFDITPGPYLVCLGHSGDTSTEVFGCLCMDFDEEQAVLGSYPRGPWPLSGGVVDCAQ